MKNKTEVKHTPTPMTLSIERVRALNNYIAKLEEQNKALLEAVMKTPQVPALPGMTPLGINPKTKTKKCKICKQILTAVDSLREFGECNPCGDRRIQLAKLKEENSKIVQSGVCPLCKASLRCNLSLTGWWQCEQLGAATHRKDPSKPACSWEAFV